MMQTSIYKNRNMVSSIHIILSRRCGGRMFAWEDTTNRQTLMIYGQLHVLSSSDPLFSTC